MIGTLGIAAAAGIGLGLSTPRILRALPEPADPSGGLVGPDEADEPKIQYASLATPRFAVTIGGLAALASTAAGILLPLAVLPVWLALSTVGLLLAAIDARTTWLPLPLTRVAWLATAVALALGGLLGSWADTLRGLGGFVVAGALFGLVWWLTRGGFGFGDVRYAPLVGAATASVSWSLLAWALVLGSLAGALLGLVRLATGKRGAFAYAPSILAGGYLALLARWLLS